MTPQMHAGLHSLIGRFYRKEITEEEWALLQVLMSYCDSCEQEFVERNTSVITERLERAAREGKEANAGLG